MKKIFAILAFAAMTLTVSAQGWKTFDCKLFSCQYPARPHPGLMNRDAVYN